MMLLLCEHSSQLTDFHEIRYECYCTRRHPKTVLCAHLESSITKWRTGELLKCYRLLRQLMYDSKIQYSNTLLQNMYNSFSRFFVVCKLITLWSLETVYFL